MALKKIQARPRPQSVTCEPKEGQAIVATQYMEGAKPVRGMCRNGECPALQVMHIHEAGKNSPTAVPDGYWVVVFADAYVMVLSPEDFAAKFKVVK